MPAKKKMTDSNPEKVLQTIKEIIKEPTEQNKEPSKSGKYLMLFPINGYTKGEVYELTEDEVKAFGDDIRKV